MLCRVNFKIVLEKRSTYKTLVIIETTGRRRRRRRRTTTTTTTTTTATTRRKKKEKKKHGRLHGNKRMTHNSSRIITMMIMATPNGKGRENKSKLKTEKLKNIINVLINTHTTRDNRLDFSKHYYQKKAT